MALSKASGLLVLTSDSASNAWKLVVALLCQQRGDSTLNQSHLNGSLPNHTALNEDQERACRPTRADSPALSASTARPALSTRFCHEV